VDPEVAADSPSRSPWAHKAARDLSFPEVLAVIARYAVTAETRDRILATRPFASQVQAEQEHTWVREALSLMDCGNALPINHTTCITSTIHTLTLGSVASGAELFNCGVCLKQALLLHKHTTRHSAQCPTLASALVAPNNLAPLIDTLHNSLAEGGQLQDRASDGLRAARSALLRARESVKQEQAELLRRYKIQLSGEYFAEREGRFVLPLRADAERIEGTILGSSASGNTLYVEPQELTQHNNRLRLAEARVQQEEQLVLVQLSALVRARLEDLIAAAEQCELADRIAAIAVWASRTSSIPVEFASTPVLRLQQFRHPLLIPTDVSTPSLAVANDLELRPGQALILSGPNAGGKTVALKCLGLAVWLSKCGLPLPCAANSEIGWFSDVFTDIGDDQSIARSLSTFSSHIVHLAHCIDVARSGVLILLDEIAGGTDPDEGAALAEAVLRALVASEASIAITTHYPRLKQLAASDEATFHNASVGFDLDTMQPTFRVTMGIPGVSSALAVATRFGIPKEVVDAAQGLLPKEHQAQQRLLQRISRELDKTTANRDASDALLQETQRKAGALEAEHQQALQRDRMALEKLRAELTTEVKQARADLMRAKSLLTLPTKDNYRDAESLVNQAAFPITVEGSLTRALRLPATRGAALTADAFTPGMTVHLSHLGMDAQVLEAPNRGLVRVSVGGLKMSVPLAQVQKARRGTSTPISKAVKAKTQQPAPTQLDALRTPRNTCDVRGKRVDEGLSEIDAFLDQMLQLNEPAAFVLHGHGTGAMKAAVREHLAASPVVRQFEPASHANGGDAFTVAWLR
jgi:DNA mismatch repair protein MutS2